MWMLVTFALTWDILGGRMGYNSFGNIVFFGVGMYAAVMTQHELYFDIGQFEVISDKINLQLTPAEYLFGLGLECRQRPGCSCRSTPWSTSIS